MYIKCVKNTKMLFLHLQYTSVNNVIIIFISMKQNIYYAVLNYKSQYLNPEQNVSVDYKGLCKFVNLKKI